MIAALPDDEAERLAALHEHRILDTPPEQEFDNLVRLAAYICGTPIAAVSLIDEHRQWFKSITGLNATETPRDMAFCAHTILHPDLMVVANAQSDARFADNPLVTGDPSIRFYAGAPLVTDGGHALGSLCVIDRVPRSLTPEQEAALRTLARQVVGQMELARQVAAQEWLIVELERAEAALLQSHRILQENQARLVEAQRIGGIGDWELDVAARCFTWSAEVFRLMEFDPAQGEPPYEAVQARYHPEDRARRDRLFAHALATGEPYQCDLRLALPSGTPRWCHLVGRPIVGAGGMVKRVAGTALDITERMEREQRVREANLVLEVQKAQLQAANAELSALATTDPLTGLLNHRAFQARLAEETARAQRGGTTPAVAVLDLTDFRFFNGVYGNAVGDAVLRQVAERLGEVCGAGAAVARFGGDEFTVLLPNVGRERTPAEVETRLRAGLEGLSYRPAGEVSAIPIMASVGAALLPPSGRGGQAADGQEALQRADERLRRAKTGGDVETEADLARADAGRSLDGFSMLDALVTAVDNKDRYTRRHSDDVMEYSLMIARELGIGGTALQMVGVAALLHDVGKIGVPDAILRKPGRLTDEEFEAVKQHPMMGAAIVSSVPGLEETLDAVRHHHERWDGQGYPLGLRDKETPLLARLMAVADAFSAMTTDRPYREGMDRAKAAEILAAGAGTQWDPVCVQAFLRASSRAPAGRGDGDTR